MIDGDRARFFARNGFLQLRGLVPADVCDHFVERTWRHLPAHWRRDDASSWRGPVEDSCHVAGLDRRGGLMKFASGCSGRALEARRELLADPAVTATWQDPSPCHTAAMDLIGRPLDPILLRGLYAIAPLEDPRTARAVPSPHVEAHPAQIVAMTYLADVAPGGGGLLVWPGSHRDLHPAFGSRFEYVERAELAPRIAAHLRWRPMELSGGRGDVLLMHHRLLHSPSINRCDRIRFAFLCDYKPRDHVELCKLPPAGLWDDWPGLVQRAGADGLDGEPDFERLPAVVEPSHPVVDVASERTRNKADASRLGRARQPGDVWVCIADTAELSGSNERLDPRGGELAAGPWPWSRGIRVSLNGAALRSVTRGGFTARLTARSGTNVLRIRGVTGPLWVRVIALALPFRESQVPLRAEVDGRTSTVDLAFDLAAAAVAP